MNIIYTKSAKKDLDKLPSNLRERIIRKLRWYRMQKAPLSFAKRLTKPSIGMFRFEIGDYRAAFDVANGTLEILYIRHRSKAYDDF